ncbi:MAG: hypothetical protein R2941_25050 [Desulfobacterales bacterium]
MRSMKFFRVPMAVSVFFFFTLLWMANPASVLCKVTQTAVVATVAADYSSAAHSVISVEPAGGPRTVQNDLLPTLISDITVSAYENFFYRIERFQADNVTKFDIANPSVPVWQFSTLDSGETGSGNPYGLYFVNSQKAYLLRYGKSKAWIVNPSAAAQSEFKIGELDLSAYADDDGIPEMNSAAIAEGKLFVTLQRLDQNNGWLPSHTAYVAVFDTATDTEITVCSACAANNGGVKGIALPIRNIGAIQYLEENSSIYVQGVGDYGSSWSGRDPEYSGGIVRIDPDTYAVSMILDDGDADNHPYGNISGMSIVSADKGYFAGYDGWGDNTLYEFNPSDGTVRGIANEALRNKNIAGMESGAYADENGMLWVCNQTDAEVVILDTSDNSIDETISTNLNPVRVVFTTEGEPDSGSEADTDSGGGGGGCFLNTLF